MTLVISFRFVHQHSHYKLNFDRASCSLWQNYFGRCQSWSIAYIHCCPNKDIVILNSVRSREHNYVLPWIELTLFKNIFFLNRCLFSYIWLFGITPKLIFSVSFWLMFACLFSLFAAYVCFHYVMRAFVTVRFATGTGSATDWVSRLCVALSRAVRTTDRLHTCRCLVHCLVVDVAGLVPSCDDRTSPGRRSWSCGQPESGLL